MPKMLRDFRCRIAIATIESPAPVVLRIAVIGNDEATRVYAESVQSITQTIAGVIRERQDNLL